MLARRDRLIILNHHRIGDALGTPYDSGTFSATGAELEAQVAYLKKYYHMATLDHVTEIANGKGPKKPSILLTFDDGYLDNYQTAFPILRAYGVQGVFFLPTGFVGTPYLPWWDSVAYIVKHSQVRVVRLEYPELAVFDIERQPMLEVIVQILRLCKRPGTQTDLFITALESACECRRPSFREGRCFLNWEEAREMDASGMAFGSHTHSHEILTKLSPEQQTHELRISREVMEKELRREVLALAYPVGRQGTFSGVTVDAAKAAGYRLAFSNYGGINAPRRTNVFDVRRNDVQKKSLARLRLEIGLSATVGISAF